MNSTRCSRTLRILQPALRANQIEDPALSLPGEKPVNEVVEALGLTQTNTSRHLNLLYRAGVVDRRRSGSQVSIASSIRILSICAGRSV